MGKTLLVPLFVIAMVVIAGGTFLIGKNATKNEKAETVDCRAKGPSHNVEIRNGQTVPSYTQAKSCDELTITNKDDKLRLISFGVHDEHISYDDVTEKALKKDESLSVTLNQPGKYIFHDHFQEEVSGQFNVE